MALKPGSYLGPYEILAPLGAGGMGEVYRAKDPRLAREVAIKVLPASFSQDRDRLRRFEQEARAAGALNHPNITAVYDIGTHDGGPYVVSELLEGETLRGRLAGGSLPPRKAIDYALQIARGLAAAHEKGIVHRDLKPENLFVTKDGRVKILDFGLAKLVHPEEGVALLTDLPTASAGTEPGVVLGTLGYMSPEQVRGKPADHRSDIFSFGAILYETLSGRRAFRGDTAADTMSAILMKEPPDLSVANQNIPPALERIVRHCLEKNPEERFYSAHDLAFDLEALSGVSGPGAVPAIGAPARRFRLGALFVGLGLLAALALGFFAGTRFASRPPPSFHRLTFHRGEIASARFAPDGQTILYAAAWEGKPLEVFANRPESPESRPFGLAGAEVLSISGSGEMALSLGRHPLEGFVRSGTLARMAVAGGGAPREILEEVHWADWAPDGASLAVIRSIRRGRHRLEFPIGKVLYETTGWVSHARVSPKGDRVAFLDHPARGNDGGMVAVVDLSGKKKTLTGVFTSAQGLAWSPGGGEIWFTAGSAGSSRALQAVTLSGHSRLLVRVTAGLTLQDVSRDGRVLMTQDSMRRGILGRLAGEEKERDLSWLDWSLWNDLSADGKTLLFSETGEGGGAGSSLYLRKTDGSPAVRLGEGSRGSLSPDGKWVTSIVHLTSEPQLVVLPTGAGEVKRLPRDGLNVQNAAWLPDGKRVVFSANEPGHGFRIYLRDLAGGKPRALTPEGYESYNKTVSPDGKFIVAQGPDLRRWLCPLEGGEPTPLPALTRGDLPTRWSADGRSLYVFRRGELPAKVYRLDVATGRKELWRELMPADPAGVSNIVPLPTPDGGSYVYSYGRTLSDLFLVEGLK